VSLRDDFTSPKVLTADVHEVGILGKRPRESRTISCVPRFLKLANEVRNDPLTIRVHLLSLIRRVCLAAQRRAFTSGGT
jgi:hypothetical protein